MTDIRILVVDDEPLVRRDIIRQLAAHAGVTVIGEARNGLEALEQIDALTPDVVFLDVQMPELDGLGVISALDADRRPVLVFVTAYDQYALAAFDAEAVDYLLKPFDAERFGRALTRARQRVDDGNGPTGGAETRALIRGGERPRYLTRLAVRGVRRIEIVDVGHIRWIEASDNYVRLHTVDGTHLTRRTMRDLAAALDPSQFARIHRSAIVNVSHVRALKPIGDGDYEVTMHDGKVLSLTRSYREGFVERYGGVA